jgi:hypothetical protein
LQGTYVFGDLCHPGLRALGVDAPGSPVLWRLGVGAEHLVSIDEDEHGELLLVSTDGGVFRLEPR